jgi:hypothetical protein
MSPLYFPSTLVAKRPFHHQQHPHINNLPGDGKGEARFENRRLSFPYWSCLEVVGAEAVRLMLAWTGAAAKAVLKGTSSIPSASAMAVRLFLNMEKILPPS